MSGTGLVATHAHLISSTKERQRWISPSREVEIWAYLGGIAERIECPVRAVGGLEDHVHMLIDLPATMCVSDLAKRIKGASSRWIHETNPDMSGFAWQEGYGAISVDRRGLDNVVGYIRNQRIEHERRSLADELAISAQTVES